MAKVKTGELTGAALDWAVAISKGIPAEELYIQKWGSRLPPSIYRRNRDEDGNLDGSYTSGPDLLFSRKWEAGGPIIQREGISTRLNHKQAQLWEAYIWLPTQHDQSEADSNSYTAFGMTPLIAAMRCFCCSKLGDVVDIPEELCQQQNS